MAGHRVAGLPQQSADGGGLSEFARPLGGYQTKPAYPEGARRQGIEGTTTLRFEVLADGHVGRVSVATSAGHASLDRAAMEAVKTWLFEPARRGKEAVAVWVTLPVQFRLQ
jgi:protein TonB